MSDYRNPEPLFCPPPARVFSGLPSAADLDREAEELRLMQATCDHRPIFTVERGWHCRECGAKTE